MVDDIKNYSIDLSFYYDIFLGIHKLLRKKSLVERTRVDYPDIIVSPKTIIFNIV